MDLLSEILQTVNLRGIVYFHAGFQSPWGMEIPAGQFANYHIVTDGECWVDTGTVDGQIQLQKGDMVLFPHGDSHSLADSPHTATVSADELLNNARVGQMNEIVFGGEGSQSSSLICGHFEYDRECSHPLFESLPEYIHISVSDNPNAYWFATASELAMQVSGGNSMGKDAVINRLAETLFIQALSEYLESIDNLSSFLAAIQDKNIGLVLKSMHDEIAHDWSITELANIAAMSRSVFSSRFHSMVGEPPIIYLARWRMLKAREMLKETSMPISVISEKVGYQSEFSFSRAFKKMTGLTPGSVRKSVVV
ncbi:MAG: AraC family transcriptional regulator [Gammaproteobacteria bacterium]|nr:AraC family transcriptional regulator [Gammaproteobacteria bacterium]